MKGDKECWCNDEEEALQKEDYKRITKFTFALTPFTLSNQFT